MIVNKDRSGFDRLTPLLKNYVSDVNSLAYSLYEYYSRLDQKKEKGEIEFPTITPKLKEAIIFGILRKGNSYKKGDKILKILNPNFTMVTGISAEVEDNTKMKSFDKIMNLIQSGNLLITFNCE